MSDDKPMRHEDYMAMAEENRRLTAENAQLKDRPRRLAALRPVLRRVLSFAVGAVAGFCLVRAAAHLYMMKPTPTPGGRTTTCYFARGNSDVDPKQPWKNVGWGLYRSDCSGCFNHLVASAPDYGRGFSSREEVMGFIEKYRLEACR